MKFRVILSAALITGVFSARATTQSTAALTNANPQTAMAALFGDPVIVKAKGFEIKRNDFDKVVSGAKANALASGQQLPPGFSISILEQLISIQALLQTANAADRAAGQVDADLQYTNLSKRFTSQEAFERQLKAVGMTVDELRAKATQEAVAKEALKRQLSATATDEEVKDFYTKHAAAFDLPERVHVRHILILTIDPETQKPLATNALAAKRKQIDDLREQIVKGADFSVLARQYSEDPGSRENGGDLPLFARASVDPNHAMVPEFEAAAFALNKDEVSPVVTTKYGYHIIKMIEKVPAKKFGLTDVLPEAEGETVEKICRAQVEAIKTAKLAPAFIKKIRAEQDVQIMDPDLKAMEDQAMASEAAAAALDSSSSTNK